MPAAATASGFTTVQLYTVIKPLEVAGQRFFSQTSQKVDGERIELSRLALAAWPAGCVEQE